MKRCKRFGLVPAVCCVVIVGGFLLPGAATGQASPYVPNLDPAYRDLDALVAAGLVHTAIMGQRPYSRMAFARFVREARERLSQAGVGPPKARQTEALGRLEERFAEEIADLCPRNGDPCDGPRTRAHLREIGADVTLADSPSRAIPTNHTPGSNIDASLNPLLQRNQGRVLADSWTAAAELAVDAVAGPHLAAYLRPRMWAAGPSGGADATADVVLQDAYARGVLGNVALDVGRNHVVHGHGRQGGPVLSHNPRGYDMIRLSLEQPVRLPWILGVFGPVQGSAFIADMGENRDIPNSKLIVFQLSARPLRQFEFGAILLNLQGGDGAVEGTLWERFKDLFLISPQGRQLSDKALGVDFRFTFPEPGLEVFVEGLVTDMNEEFDNFSNILVNEGAWVGGVRLMGVDAQGRIDVWTEAHRSGIIPHTHHQFTSGLTLDNRLLGHPLGLLATGWEVGAAWQGPDQTVSFTWNWDRFSGDEYRRRGLLNWDRIADNPDEIRIRFRVDWNRGMGLAGVNSTVRLGYERVTRFNFSGENRSNLLVQALVDYRW